MLVAIDGGSTTSCFRLGAFKSGMFHAVESKVKMARSRLQGGDGKVGMARWRLESRERAGYLNLLS